MIKLSNYDLIYFMDYILACLVSYICMTCCRWHDRIPSTFRLYLLSIVAHPFPSFLYIYVGPLLHLERALLQFDAQRSIGLRRYLSCSSRLLWFVYTTCHFLFAYSLFTVVSDCKWVATDWCGSTCFSYSVPHICPWYYLLLLSGVLPVVRGWYRRWLAYEESLGLYQIKQDILN